MTTPWVKLKFKVWAIIDDVRFDDVVRFSGTWEHNSIPMASLLVAVGVNQDGKPATIHGAGAKISVRSQAEVFLQVFPSGGDGLPEPLAKLAQPTRIWLGKVAGGALNRSRDEVAYQIHLTHWLDALNNSSTVNSTVHPHSPGDFAHAALYPGVETRGADAGTRMWIPLIDDQEIPINAGSLEADFWGEVLHKWLLRVSNADLAKLDLAPGEGAGISGNAAAVEALNRMKSTSKFSIPLAMDLANADGGAVSDGVKNALTHETFNSWVHTTVWGKLIGEWSPSYFFTVIPRIEDALVVPFTGTLRKPYIAVDGAEYSVSGKEYTHSAVVNQLPQLLQAIGVWHGAQLNFNGNGQAVQGDQPAGYKKIAGWYNSDPNSPLGTRGMILIKDAPGWLQDPVSPGGYAALASGAGGDGLIGTACAPGEGTAPTKQGPTAIVKTLSNILDNFAHHWYTLEQLKGRTLEISGKLRFDIAPGSTIKIQGGGDAKIGKDDLNITTFATVLRTSILLDCEAQQAGTAFSLAHIRSESENSDDKTSVDKPPLYKQGWSGAPLADIFAS
jgi:hypothetical protein